MARLVLALDDIDRDQGPGNALGILVDEAYTVRTRQHGVVVILEEPEEPDE